MPEFFRDICPENYQNAWTFMTYAQKINQIPEFYMIFVRKLPEFYMTIAQKIFFRKFWGRYSWPPPPVFYANEHYTN